MKGPSMNISYGGESNKQQKSDLLKDNPVAKHASAMNMSDAQDNNLPEGLQDELPQEGRTSPTSKKGSMLHMADKNPIKQQKKGSGLYKKGSALLKPTRNSGDKDTSTDAEKEKTAAANALRAAKIAKQHAAAKKVAKKSKK